LVNRRGRRENGEIEAEENAPAPELPQSPPWVDGAAESTDANRRGNVASSRLQLPRFLPSDATQALAYVIVGPQVRGKFNAVRAKELGLVGRNCGLVARGATVTFTVDDGKGGTIERTVRPEEVMGATELPNVCTCIFILFPSQINNMSEGYMHIRRPDAETYRLADLQLHSTILCGFQVQNRRG